MSLNRKTCLEKGRSGRRIDSGTPQVMVDHALALPWDRYENYDMVVWGVRERVEEGEMEGASLLASFIPLFHLRVVASIAQRRCLSSNLIVTVKRSLTVTQRVLHVFCVCKMVAACEQASTRA